MRSLRKHGLLRPSRAATLVALGLALRHSPAAAAEPSGAPVAAAASPGSAGSAGARWVERLDVEGNTRTRTEAVLELLPRRPPASYDDAELTEFERRLNSLGVFDQVAVGLEGRALRVRVRDKFALAPNVALSTGKTLRDTFVLLGATDTNFLGRAGWLGGSASYGQRGFNGELFVGQHEYHPSAWTASAYGSAASASVRFAEGEGGPGWQRNRYGAELWLRPPFGYGSPLRTYVAPAAFREAVSYVEGGAGPPRGGWYGGLIALVRLDRYWWHDLVPRGLRVDAELRAGALFPDEGRAQASLTALGALPLGRATVLVANAVAQAVTAGNPNHSVLLGSQQGVRGLPDALYRGRSLAYANLELRHALRLGARWALQGVAFADAGAVERFDPRGRPAGSLGAFGAGAGARLVPTFLNGLLARVDVARLLAPEPAWFAQTGFAQYF